MRRKNQNQGRYFKKQNKKNNTKNKTKSWFFEKIKLTSC